MSKAMDSAIDETINKTKNTTFIIKIGGFKIQIQALYTYIQGYCKDYLVKTEKNEEAQLWDFSIKIQAEDIAFERQKSEAEDLKEGIPIRAFSDEYLETLAVYRKIVEQMIDYNTLLFHGSVIAVDGVGYLFTAKSGTGKSTHTKLWREYFGERAVMVNDDKPLLRMTDEGVIVYGTPWDGKHRLSHNMSVPLKAICILKRDQTNHIEQVSGKDVYPLLLQQTYRSTNPLKMGKTLQLLDKLLQEMKFYVLGCNREQEAAVVSYKGMQ